MSLTEGSLIYEVAEEVLKAIMVYEPLLDYIKNLNLKDIIKVNPQIPEGMRKDAFSTLNPKLIFKELFIAVNAEISHKNLNIVIKLVAGIQVYLKMPEEERPKETNTPQATINVTRCLQAVFNDELKKANYNWKDIMLVAVIKETCNNQTIDNVLENDDSGRNLDALSDEAIKKAFITFTEKPIETEKDVFRYLALLKKLRSII